MFRGEHEPAEDAVGAREATAALGHHERSSSSAVSRCSQGTHTTS
jgi:hypothetical protein